MGVPIVFGFDSMVVLVLSYGGWYWSSCAVSSKNGVRISSWCLNGLGLHLSVPWPDVGGTPVWVCHSLLPPSYPGTLVKTQC